MLISIKKINSTGDVMVSVLDASVVDREFEP